MKCFIWRYVGKCSDSYHESGGVVVVAVDEQAARALANSVEGCDIKTEEAPDCVLDVLGDVEPRVFIMPDAGCC